MMTVMRFEVEPDGSVHNVPNWHRWLSVQMQRGIIYAWALVDQTHPHEIAHLEVVTTGECKPYLKHTNYLGTVAVSPHHEHHYFAPKDRQ